ncbi:MAG: Rieske 2Fe-2S domain-containing protein [Pseudomonadales bacterium]|nr:Rieske 2Fe-2S domain-containing protein [Pseudomonadales bacterium]
MSEKIDTAANAEHNYAAYLDERPDTGIYRLDRRVFTDPALFEQEMKYIFEKTWLYLCHESQLAKPFDFITTYMGRQPVIINRNKDGQIQGFINACAHRGAQLVNVSKGNKRIFACPFHGWCYKADGSLVDYLDNDKVGYSEAFNPDELGLTKVPHISSYRGFIFGCLDQDVGNLTSHLAEATKMIDMLADQSEQGLEVIPGVLSYTFEGNWKLQAENGVDGFHVDAIHSNYMQTVKRRADLATDDTIKASSLEGLADLPGGYYHLGNGHAVLWNEFPGAENRPLYPRLDELAEKYGELRATWMTKYLRNLLIYPNLFLMDQMSTQIRVFRPISVNKTEVTTYCFAPIGESREARSTRIRQYEDFFNASGMATPDDLAAFGMSQTGFNGENSRWSDMSRGATNLVKGPEQFARQLDINPLESGTQFEDEGLMVAQHRRWLELMTANN